MCISIVDEYMGAPKLKGRARGGVPPTCLCSNVVYTFFRVHVPPVARSSRPTCRLCCSLPSRSFEPKACSTWPCGRAESAFRMPWRPHLRYAYRMTRSDASGLPFDGCAQPPLSQQLATSQPASAIQSNTLPWPMCDAAKCCTMHDAGALQQCTSPDSGIQVCGGSDELAFTSEKRPRVCCRLIHACIPFQLCLYCCRP